MTREPEWSGEQRDRLLALRAHDARVCECGIHEDVTGDPANLLTIDSRVCPICKALAVDQRVRDAADEKAMKAHGENPPPSAPRPSDGRRTFIRGLTPEEALRTQAKTPAQGGTQ